MSRRYFQFQAMDMMRIFSRHRRTMLRHSASQRRVSLRLITLATLAKPQAWRLAWLLGLPAMLRTRPQRWRVATAGWVALQAGLLGVSVIVVRAGPVHYVAHGGQPVVPNYESWDTAASNIQDAIDVAGAPDTVWVSNGVYNVGLTKTPSYSVSNRVCITVAITLRSFSNDPTTTIIEGAADPGDAVNGFGSNAVRCVWLNGGASLIGFTLTNGHTFALNGGALNDRCGGGVILYASCVVSNCIMVTNKAQDYGGGACIVSGVATLNNCLLKWNFAGSYGGGANIDWDGTMNNCTLVGNSCNAYGGAVAMAGRSTLNNCVLSSNSSLYGPGGVTTCCGGKMTNCLVVGNWARNLHPTAGGPGGIQSGGGSLTIPVKLDNCTLVNNSAKIRGGGVHLSRQTDSNIMNNCIVWGNTCDGDSYSNINISAGATVTVNNTCSGPVQTGGGGNIGIDPLLANTNIGDYRLSANSPCINTGTNQSWMTGAFDPDGRRRKDYFSGHVDMGCYEYVPKGTMFKVP